MKQEEILKKLTSIEWIENGECCVYTRRIPSFVYPFALGRKEGFAHTLRIYIREEGVWEYLNCFLHRKVTGKEADEWRKWAKMQKEEN